MVHGLLIAQVEHGPQLHGGPVLIVLLAIVLLAGLAYVLLRRGRKGSTRGDASRISDRDLGSDRWPKA